MMIMSNFITQFLPLLLLSGLILSDAAGNQSMGCPEVEKEALLKFKRALSDPSGRLSSWVDSGGGEDCCKWRGIGCHKKTGRVIKLSLEGADDETVTGRLSGKIDPSLLDLRYLNYLDLSMNDFAGIEIPKFIGSIGNLRYLGLSGSFFGGPVPTSIANLSYLQYLDLSNNGFDDSTFPPWLFNLSNLQHLDLGSSNLRGELPDAFQNLPSLRLLDLSMNNIDGEFPTTLGSLCSLQTLILSGNKLSGDITEFVHGLSACSRSSSNIETLNLGMNELTGNLPDSLGNLKKLRYFDIRSNSFRGSIPESIGNLSSLQEVYLSNNYGIGGVIPESIGQLSSLAVLEMNENSWEGVVTEAHMANLSSLKQLPMTKGSGNISVVFNISDDWTPPFKLTYINLRSCQLGPQFPTWLRAQNELTTVVLNNARISGTIPDWLWQLDSPLLELDLAYNRLTGRVPNSLPFAINSNVDLSSNLFDGPLPLWSSNVTTIYLRGNMFSGCIPHNIGERMPNLTDLDISWNSLEGGIPSSMANLHLITFVISNNNLSGEIPHFWDQMPALAILDMSNNSLSGTIPPSLGSLTALRFLALSNNRLSGELPPQLRNCSALESIDLGFNGFSGNIPGWIGESMPYLLILALPANSFSGSIPEQLCALSSLHILDLSRNNLSELIPLCLGNLSGFKAELSEDDISRYQGNLKLVAKGRTLEYNNILYLVNSMDLSGNRLTGEIPVELTGLFKLGTLNLSNNHLWGRIPEKIGNLQWLETLDLSRNNLSGPIPMSMASITFLVHLNLSHNMLSGKIPTGNQFQTLIDPSIYQGNLALCGFPLSTCDGGVVNGTFPTTENEGSDDDEFPWFFVSMGLGFVVGFWGVCGSLTMMTSWRYAYFRLVERMKDRLLLAVALNVARLTRRN